MPGACSYDVSVQNTGGTSWTGPLGFKSPVSKPHHIRKVKSFHNESTHKVETEIGKEFFLFISGKSVPLKHLLPEFAQRQKTGSLQPPLPKGPCNVSMQRMGVHLVEASCSLLC